MLKLRLCRGGETGRRARFRSVWGKTHGGSIPLLGTAILPLCSFYCRFVGLPFDGVVERFKLDFAVAALEGFGD